MWMYIYLIIGLLLGILNWENGWRGVARLLILTFFWPIAILLTIGGMYLTYQSMGQMSDLVSW